MNRLEELQNELKLESKQRLENEVEMRTSLEATNTKMKMYCDESVEAARQITVVNYYLNAPFYLSRSTYLASKNSSTESY